ncbi:MAG: hypothetical protein OER90_14290 [Gemmatimonadota bacterium]|nr:hypothetical protein [Gemmatimonadota bacterium]
MTHSEHELRFLPGFGRFLLCEMGTAPKAIAFGSAIAVLMGEPIVSASLLGLTILAASRALYHAAFFRSLRVLTIASDYVRGPCPNPVYGSTIPRDQIDWSRTGIRSRRLEISSESGDVIRVKLSWFSREQQEAIRRAMRDSASLSEIPESLTYAG